MDLPDLTTYTDEDFDALHDAVEKEITRRTLLERIPEQVTALAAQYADAGGDRATLSAAVGE